VGAELGGEDVMAQALRGRDLAGVVGDEERVAAGPGGCGGGQENGHLHCVGNRPARGVSAEVAPGVHQVNGFLSESCETVFGMQIDARFNGPPTSGNGGWSAGCFAVAAGATLSGPPTQVTLRLPPPLETELVVTDGRVTAGERLIAEVTAGTDPGDGVPAVSLAEAGAASRAYPGFADHPFPTCYVCGPERPDGLRIFAGPTGDGRMAAPWSVPAGVTLPTMWAALDCPGGWSALHVGRTYVLGRITATVSSLPAPGDTCVAVGGAVSVAGRKAVVDSSVYGADGCRLAVARATWIAV
jgi:hypothetical protein